MSNIYDYNARDLLTELESKGFTSYRVALICECNSLSHIYKIKNGEIKNPSTHLWLKLIRLHKVAMRRKGGYNKNVDYTKLIQKSN